ncbi:hypothetical protein ACWDSL_31320 [Streptomyces sp. NPDC000941]
MGWNIEVVAVRQDELYEAVPDVFIETSTTMSFEEATSGRRVPHLCAAKVGDWVVVIDAGCRLSGNYDYLDEASTSTDLHLVRIADKPIALHYRDGQQVLEATGSDAVPELTPDDDGESWAMHALFKRTGVNFGEEDPLGLWNAKFTLFTI